jgi:hypothetical protein
MQLTYDHAECFAYQLTRRCPPDSVEKLAAAMGDAKVDANPHQIDAALFAFRSPLSKGPVLADVGGLGKATEPGAEGINRQLCSLAVNYDVLWNPQRIEPRIGRCHRNGEQRDVLGSICSSMGK